MSKFNIFSRFLSIGLNGNIVKKKKKNEVSKKKATVKCALISKVVQDNIIKERLKKKEHKTLYTILSHWFKTS